MSAGYSVLDPAANKAAEYAAEVLMSGVGQEASGVCKHADKVAQAS